jgi:chromate reductase
MKILGISGSLRAQSFNTSLLHAAFDMLPQGAELTVRSCADIPLYNEDLDVGPKPAAVADLNTAIAESDALILATPEYNHSIPGVLKNALDWISRPAFKSVMVGKPTGIISASKSFVGGARVQMHLRLVLDSMLVPVFPHTDVLVGAAADRVASDGVIKDSVTQTILKSYLEKFVRWADAIKNVK